MIPVIPFDFLRVVPTAAVIEALHGFDAREAAVVLAFAPPPVGAEIIATLPQAVTDALAEMEAPTPDSVRLIEQRLEFALRQSI